MKTLGPLVVLLLSTLAFAGEPSGSSAADSPQHCGIAGATLGRRELLADGSCGVHLCNGSTHEWELKILPSQKLCLKGQALDRTHAEKHAAGSP